MPLTDVTVRFLELDPKEFSPKHAKRAGVTFSLVNPPMPEFNRFFYTTIGGRWMWLDRRWWTAAEWSSRVLRDGVTTWALAVDGTPAGFVELERLGDHDVEIAYLGLLDAFVGRRLGAHILTCAVERALEMGAKKVHVNTCSLDHPKALSNYVARGFREVRSEFQRRDLPERAPVEWNGVNEARASEGARSLLRHTIAVVAYRGGKALRGAPASFAEFSVAPGSRTPIRILAHISDLYDWALSIAKNDEKWNNSTPSTWEAETTRFFSALQAFDAYLAKDVPLGMRAEQLFAGPVADSLTHIGQLTMLRRVAGSPVKGENYSRADIVAGRVGAEQSAPAREFD